jgi:putative PIN family toxin of toxin-antitoxin system
VRAVLDANVLVSAALSGRGAPAELVRRALHGELEMIVSEHLIQEVERTLASTKLAGRGTPADKAAYVGLLRDIALRAADSSEPSSLHSSDPDDDYLLALARQEHASLVSGDAHLLELRDRAPIFTPRELLDRLEA